MSFQPSRYQQAIFDHIAVPENGHLLINALAGSGKCLGRGTKVLLYDGTVLPVEQITTGDLLMGPDSRSRRVLSTTVGRGPLFRITPVKGDPWICNDAHVMTLTGTNYRRGQIIDIPLSEALQLFTGRDGRADRTWKLLRTGVEFETETPLPFDPYLVGLWLAEGSRGEAQFTISDPEPIEFLKVIAEKLGMIVTLRLDNPRGTATSVALRMGARGEAGRHTPCALRRFLQGACIDESGEKRFPDGYLTASRWDRLALLAGLLDGDGHLENGYFEIIAKTAFFANSLLFLARSLGFAAYESVKSVQLPDWDAPRDYYRVTISGDVSLIPCLVKRKQAAPRRQIKRVTVTGWSAEPIGEGDYYGFTLNGDGRFLLGDFTVTHNTSTLIAALNQLPEERVKRTLLCAFNTSIRDELAARSPKSATVKTIHSIGYSTLAEHFVPAGKWGIRVEGGKYRLLLDRYLTIYPLPVELEGGYEDEQRKSRRDTLLQLLDLVRLTLTDTSDEAAIVALAEGYDLEVWDPKSVAQTLRTILKWGIEGMPEEHLDGDDEASPEVHGARWSIDFADMVWLPHAMNLQPRQFALVLVDEVQDLSAAQRELVLKCVEADGMLVMVGDPHQAIYAFAGADARSWQEIRERVRPTELPLSICYRCPKAVIQEAQEIVPEIECAPDAFDGSVERIEQRDIFNFVRPGDMVLCRTTAPLVGCCLQLLQRGTAAVVKGRDVAKTLRRILEWCEKQPTFKFTRIGVLAEEWKDQQWLRIKDQAGADAKLASMADAVECLVAIWSSVMDSGGASCHALRAKLDGLFTDNDMKNVVSLSTIHRAKGLEQKTVFLLRPDLLPHPMAKTPTAREQERNLKYVAITRAKETLFIVLPPARS